MDSLNKRYYKIREVTQMLGVTAATLRFWESEFSRWVKPDRNEGGTRFYRPQDLEALQTIRYLLKEKGLHIQAARQQMANNREGVDRRRDVVRRLQSLRDQLQLLHDNL